MRMTREIERQYEHELDRAGLSYELGDKLRRIAITLHSWCVASCNGLIDRDEDGKAYRCYNINGPGPIKRYRIADSETAALKRLTKLLPEGATWKYQGDPRGWPLKIRVPTDPCFYTFVEINPPPYTR